MRRRALAGLIPLLAACGSVERVAAPTPEPVAPEPAASAPEPAPVPPPAAPAEPEGLSGIPLDTLGWEVIPPEPPARAFQANAKGVQQHDRGHHAEARARFEEALRLEDSYDLARYNLACALARLDEHEAALAELKTVLARDLPRFKRPVLEDPDLAHLRRGDAGDALRQFLDALEGAWAAALADGAPVVLWAGADDAIGDAQRAQGQALRPGVWRHGPKRFVPAFEVVEHPLAAFVDGPHGQVLVVTGGTTPEEPPQLRDVGLRVVPFASVGEVPRHAAFKLEALTALEVHAVAEGLRVRGNGHKGHWRELRAGGLVRSESQDPPDAAVLRLTAEGATLTRPLPAGWSHKGHRLQVEGAEITLQEGHSVATSHSLVPSPDGRLAVAVSVRARCTADGPVLRHWVDRVDVAARNAEALSQGEGAAAAVFGPDSALYLQVGDDTIRYATPGAPRYESLPARVVLVPPSRPPSCAKPD
jgi:hypothetical protein